METFFTKLFEYIGSRLVESDLQAFVETMLDSSMFVKSFSPEEYNRLRACYNKHVRPRCPMAMHPFPALTIEERLSFLESEHQNTRVIQSTFVDLLREHRDSFDDQLARIRSLI